MKTAYVKPVCFVVECPHCNTELVNPNGNSNEWETDKITIGQEVKCWSCDCVLVLPKRIVGSFLVGTVIDEHSRKYGKPVWGDFNESAK